MSPASQPLCRIPLTLRDEVTHELVTLLGMGITETVNTNPWISNLVIIKNEIGGIQICIDQCLVNKAVIPDRYLLSTSDELKAHFHGSVGFTKLSLQQGYLQVPLHLVSRDLTAFVMHTRVF